MAMVDEIHALLSAAFAPSLLEVVDDSAAHLGHAGHREGGESHFQVTIRAPVFAPMSRLARHRAVHDALGDVMGRIHALGLEVGS